MFRRHKTYICAAYEEGAVDDSTCGKCFRKFFECNFYLNGAPRFEQPTEADDNKLLPLVESDRHKTTRVVVDIFGNNQSTVPRQFHQLEMVRKSDAWMLHE